MIYIHIYIYIYLTAVGLTAGGSSTSHTYTQIVHNTEKGNMLYLKEANQFRRDTAYNCNRNADGWLDITGYYVAMLQDVSNYTR
jgi:hypothetical protein